MSMLWDDRLLAITRRSSLPECVKSPGTTLCILEECLKDDDWVNSNLAEKWSCRYTRVGNKTRTMIPEIDNEGLLVLVQH